MGDLDAVLGLLVGVLADGVAPALDQVQRVDPSAVVDFGGVKAVDDGKVATRAAKAAAFNVLSGMAA